MPTSLRALRSPAKLVPAPTLRVEIEVPPYRTAHALSAPTGRKKNSGIGAPWRRVVSPLPFRFASVKVSQASRSPRDRSPGESFRRGSPAAARTPSASSARWQCLLVQGRFRCPEPEPSRVHPGRVRHHDSSAWRSIHIALADLILTNVSEPRIRSLGDASFEDSTKFGI